MHINIPKVVQPLHHETTLKMLWTVFHDKLLKLTQHTESWMVDTHSRLQTAQSESLTVVQVPYFDIAPLLKAAHQVKADQVSEEEDFHGDTITTHMAKLGLDPPLPCIPQKRTCPTPDTNLTIPKTQIPYRHIKRRKKRDSAILEQGHVSKSYTIKTHVQPSLPLETELEMEDLPAANGGYSAKNAHYKAATKKFTLTELINPMGFTLIEWDGM